MTSIRGCSPAASRSAANPSTPAPTPTRSPRWVERRRFTSIRLVTNDLHMPRARYEVRKRVGEDVRIVADAVPTEPGFQQIFIEYNKYLLGMAADLIGI